MKKIAFIFSLFSLVVFACSKTKDSKDINKAPAKVIEIGNHEFIIEADVFRDFSDSMLSDSLQSGVRLIDRNGNSVTGLFTLNTQRIIQGSSTWNTEFDSILDGNHITYLESISYGGPLWEIGSNTDVIATFQDIETKERYEILASGVVIFEKK